MRNKKRFFSYYFLMLAFFAILIYFFFQKSEGMNQLSKTANGVAATGHVSSDLQGALGSFHHNFTQSFAVLLLQVSGILVISGIFGFLFKKMGQPAVIGQIVAGIFLGPSFLGFFFPATAHFIFPPDSLRNIEFLSQIGLILFMFVIGMELDMTFIRAEAYRAIMIGHASIVLPCALGMFLAWTLFAQFGSPGISFFSFALFVGVAMSITAFPVLARIIQERAMGGTKVGSLALACAAANDVTAWCILAVLIAIFKSRSSINAVFSVVLVILFIVVMATIIRPLLEKLRRRFAKPGPLTGTMMSLVFVILLLAAYSTEILGIHALFGAFMAGLIMPHANEFRKQMIEKIQDVGIVLLLPLYFAFVGLRTEIALLNEPYLWYVFGWILLVAVAGKFGGSSLFASFSGLNWKESLSIGALMNTRGLMELIVLNIGYDLGVLSPQIFSMMVLMALVTTCMTGPALDLINRFRINKGIQTR
jgi:Kef-type K+ transport system membrane component KefB